MSSNSLINKISHCTDVPKPLTMALTMSEKVSLVTAQLGLPEGLPVAKAVEAANKEMGFKDEGLLAAQVARLLDELGIVAESKAASHLSPDPASMAEADAALVAEADVAPVAEADAAPLVMADAALMAEADRLHRRLHCRLHLMLSSCRLSNGSKLSVLHSAICTALRS